MRAFSRQCPLLCNRETDLSILHLDTDRESRQARPKIRIILITYSISPSITNLVASSLIQIEEPELRNSAMVLEAYSLHAVQNVPAASTAFPDRENGVLMASILVWDSAGLNASRAVEIEDRAMGYGREIRDAVVRGSGGPLSAYVNYAHGDESLEAMYGYESWRVRRLRALKEEWDPENRFGWYAPIIAG